MQLDPPPLTDQQRLEKVLTNLERCVAAITIYQDLDSALAPAMAAALELRTVVAKGRPKEQQPSRAGNKRVKAAQEGSLELLGQSNVCPGRYPHGPHAFVDRLCSYCKTSET